MLEEFLNKLSETERNRFNNKYEIENCKFSKTAILQLYKNCKRNNKKSILKNSKIICFESNMLSINDSILENCYIFGSNVDINSTKLNDVSIVACPLFNTNGTTLGECHFQNGTKEISQSNPIIFNFDKLGSIVNIKPGLIDFFVYIESYDYFMARLDEYPYSEYASELNSIILMGSRSRRKV